MRIEEQSNAKVIKFFSSPEDENKMLREVIQKQRQRIRKLELENDLLWAGTKREGTLQ